jgi:penicillin-binding protein 1C
LLKALEQTGGSAEKSFPPPPGSARETQVCALSGMTAAPYCSGTTREWLPDDKVPILTPCTWHRQGGSAPEYPPEYRAWLAERFRQGLTAQAGSGGARIRLPVSGSVFYLNPALPPEAQAIRIETSGFNPGAAVYANDILQGALNHAGVFALPLRRGLQRIVVEDENAWNSVEITVR